MNMKLPAVGSFISLILSMGFAGLLDATNVRVIVEENTSGRPRIAQAEACLIANDGSVRRQVTNNNGVTVFDNVPVGSTIVRAHRSGFNQQTVTINPVAEEVVTLTLNSGVNPPVACNEQGPRDIKLSFTQTTGNPVATSVGVGYRLVIDNIGQSNASNVIARVDLPAGFGLPSFGTNPAGVTCGAGGGGGAPFRITCTAASINGGVSRRMARSRKPMQQIYFPQCRAC